MKGDARNGGFALTEILIVIGIIGFALVSLLALITLGVETNRISAEESGAVSLASAILGDLKNSPIQDSEGFLLKESTRFKFPMPLSVTTKTDLTPVRLDLDGQPVSSDSETAYWVELSYIPSGQYNVAPVLPDRQPAYVALKITWPAQSAQQNSMVKGHWECVTAFSQSGADLK